MIPMNFMKSKAGFTLVELIVVIAILGILAGIAVPAYGGYIKKANSAKDTQILAAANTAIAAAMTENLLAPADASDYLTATATGSDGKGDGCVVTLAPISSLDAADKATAEEIVKDFGVYYGNPAATAGQVTFEYYETLDTSAPITDNGTLAVSD